MEAKDIGGALAGGVIATALLYKLMDKGVLSADEAKGVLNAARKAVGYIVMNPQERVASKVLDSLIAGFPESLHK
jgi:hypothetical protein